MGCCFGTQVSPAPSEIIKLIVKASIIADETELACKTHSTANVTLEISKNGSIFLDEEIEGSETERPMASARQEIIGLKKAMTHIISTNWQKKLLFFNTNMEETPWLILNSKEKNSNGYSLVEGDVIKLGRVCFRVKTIQPKTIAQSIEPAIPKLPAKKMSSYEFSFADGPTADPSSANTTSNDILSCRICLDCTNEEDNPIVNVCKCSGSMKHVHLKCIRRWFDNKILKISSYNLLSYYHKSITCEVCHALIPSDILTEKRRYSLIDFPVIDQPHIILESFVGEKANGLHILKFGKRVKTMKLGTHEKCDIKIKDASIASKHAILSHVGESFYLKNISDNHVTQVLVQNGTVPFYQRNYFKLKVGNIAFELLPIREQKTQ